jgi:hypothetical protein
MAAFKSASSHAAVAHFFAAVWKADASEKSTRWSVTFAGAPLPGELMKHPLATIPKRTSAHATQIRPRTDEHIGESLSAAASRALNSVVLPREARFVPSVPHGNPTR